MTWTGGGTTDNWNDSGNWGGATPATGDSLVFAGTTRLTPNNNLTAGTSFARITFNAGAGNFSIIGNAFTLSGGATALTNNATSGTMTIANAITLSAASTITTTASGALVLSGAIANGANSLTVNAGGPVTMSGTITGSSATGLTKSGTGTLTLSGLSATAGNNFSGAIVHSQGSLAITGTVVFTGAFNFGSVAGSATVSDLDVSGGSVTFTGVMTARTNSVTANTITIGNAQVLTLLGGLTMGVDSYLATTTKLTVSGAGAFAITGGNVQIGVSQTLATNSTNNSVATLDLSGLTGASGFSANLSVANSNFNVGQGNSSHGFLVLTNTANTIITSNLNLGHSNGNNAVTGIGPSLMTLGTGTNVIWVDTANIGFSRADGTLAFASQASGSPGTVTIKNKAGTGNANINLGNNNGNTASGNITGLLDLRGHVATVTANTVQLGIGSNTSTGNVSGEVRFDSGTMSVGGTLTMGSKSGVGGTGTATGVVTISGGAFSAATITTAGNTAATGAAVSTITVSGGTYTAGGNINRTGGTNTTSTVTVNGGTIVGTGRTFGSAAQPITFDVQSGALTGLTELNGGGTWTKSTAGTLTLSGTNAWTGLTDISAGSVVLGSANALPSGNGKGDVTLTGTLNVAGFATGMNGLNGAGTLTSGVVGACTLTVGNNNASGTFSGVIQNGSGTVALTKTGSGTEILFGVNTYTGATTISAGILRVSGSTAVGSAVSLTGGTLHGGGTVGGAVTLTTGSIAPGDGGSTVATLTAGSLTCAVGGSLAVDLDGTGPTADRISSAGAVALNGTLTVASSSNASKGQVYTIVSAGSVSGTFTGLVNGATVMGGGRGFRITYTGTAVTLTDIAAIWDGGGGNDNWTTAANWAGDVAPVANDALIFAGTTRLTPSNTFAGGTSFASITFAAGAGAFSLSGSAFTLSAGAGAVASNVTSGTMTIGNVVTFSTLAPTITTAAGGTLVFSGAVANGGLLMTVAAGGPVTMSAAVTGTGGLTKSGAGTLTLSGLNAVAASNFTGATTHGQGTLAISGTVALTGAFNFGSAAASTTISDLDLSGGSVTFTGVMTAQTNSATANTMTIGATRTLTLVGGLTLGLNSATASTTTKLTVSGGGAMAITGGNVQIGVSQGTVNSTNNSIATLDLSGLAGASGFSTNASVTNFNVGQGNSSQGFLILSNTANTITATTMNLGHSNGNNGVTGLGANQITLGTGTNVIRCDTINIGFSKIDGTLAFASQVTGSSGTVTINNKAGAGAANIIIGSNNGTATAAVFTGLMDLRGHTATVSANALQLGIGNNTSTGSITGDLRFDTGTITVTTLTVGSKAGAAGTGAATGLLTIGGGTVTSASTVTAINTAATGSGVSTIAVNGGTFTAGGNITKTGGTNTTSTITVNGGTLNANSRTIGTALQTIVFNLQSGTLNALADLNGGGTLTKSTAGVATLSGTNAYTGSTSVTGGTLLVTGTTVASSAVTVASGATLGGSGTIGGTVTLAAGSTLAPGAGGSTIATLTTGVVTCDPASAQSFDLDGATTAADLLTSAGAINLGGTLTLASLVNGNGVRVYTIVSAGSVTGTFVGLSDGATMMVAGHTLRINYSATTVTLSDVSSVWDGGGVNDLWSTAANWVGDTVPVAGSQLVFAGSTRLFPNNDLTGVSFTSLNFAQGAGNFSLSGTTITLTGGAAALTSGAVSGTMTITAPVTFTTAAPTITTTAGGTLVLAGAIDNGGMTVTAANSGPLTISGALGGSGGLTKNGVGTVTMSGAGTYSGGTLLTRGDLVVASSGGAVNGPLGTGTMTLDSGATAARILLSGGQTVSNALVMTTLAPGNGLGGLHYTGAGLATWSGAFTLNANASSGGHVVGGTDAANALVLSGLITTGGSLTRVTQRQGWVIYAGSGGTVPELGITGTAQWGASNTLPAGVQLFLASGVLTGEIGIVDLNGFNQTVAGVTFQNMAGGSITTAAGTLTLGGDIATTFTGAPDVGVNTIAGNLNLGGATRTITVADSTAANDLSISAVIANGSLTKAGTGALAFTGAAANTYTGTTTVNAGTLLLNRTAGVNAIAGNLTIAGGKVTFGASNQIVDTATVSMSVTTSVFNGTAADTGALADFTETIAALTVTGGAFNCGASGSAPIITVTGATSFTGGGNTIFIGESGTSFITGSLSLSAMTATAGGTVATNNSFTLYGTHPTVQSRISVGAGGLTLNNSTLNLRRGGVGSQGSRLVLDGDLSATGGSNCTITEDANGGTTGAIAVELSSMAPVVTRTISAAIGGSTLTIGIPITNGASATAGVTTAGTSIITVSGGLANTYTGLTTIPSGRLNLNKTAGINAIAGDVAITGGQLSFSTSHQIADTTTVTMSGITSIFNGSGVNVGVTNVSETIANLLITGGCFNAGGTSAWSISGALSMTGGGNTIFVGNSGTQVAVGSLALTAMTATAGGTVGTNNSFTLYGAQNILSTLTIGSGGLTLDGSVLNIRRGNTTGQIGSKVVMNGNLTTTGTVASTIKEDVSGGTLGTVTMELSSSAGAATRTMTVGSGGADLTISIPVADGLATPGGVTKSGLGMLTMSAVNTCTGTLTVDGGTVRLTGSTGGGAVVNTGGTLEGSATLSGSVVVAGGTVAPGSGGTTLGTFTTGGLSMAAGATYRVDLSTTNNTSDRITSATQPIAIDGTLTVTSGVFATVGTSYTIVSGTAVTGTFANAPEGTLIPINGRAVQISYGAAAVTLTVYPAPTVTAIVPSRGLLADQVPVVITGTEFLAGATITIGGNPATSVVWNSATSLSAVTPTGLQGPQNVVVTNPDFQTGTLAGGYTYLGPTPTVTSVSPAFGPALTTTPVTITGTNFFPGTIAVSVGGVAATAVIYVTTTTMTATFPVMAASSTDTTPDVVVTIGDGQQATLANGFTYTLRTPENPSGALAGLAYRYHRIGGPLIPTFATLVPFYQGNYANATLTGINPFEARNDNWSAELGGYVTVPADGVYTFFTASDDGSRLYIGTTLVVNNNFSQGITERSGQIALTAGTHQLRVEFAQGTGVWGLFTRWQGPTVAKQDIPDNAFTCDPAPSITSITPSSGPQGGGTSLVFAGNNFVPGSTVVIGGVLAITPVVLDANTITVTTAGGPVGAQDVLVMGPRSSGTTLTGGFTYLTSAAPTLTAITPVSGTAFGGTAVTLTVSNVGVAPTVTFNGVAATSVTWVDATTVTCVTPAMPLSDITADVVVTVGGQSASLVDGYTWNGLRTPENTTGTQAGLAYSYYHTGGPLLPTFSALTPFGVGILPAFGWTTNPVEPAYTLNFSLRYLGYLTVPSDGVYTLYTASDDASRLYIGGTMVVENNFAQGVTERFGLIALSAGTHLVTIEFAQGTGGFGMYARWQGPGLAKVDIPASAFTTDSTPTVVSLDVINGPQSGGTAVTITGSGFVGGATVSFGGIAATGVTVQNSTTIVCTTPSHALGAVAVTVTNPTGTNSTLASAFTYDPSAGPTITSLDQTTGPAGGGTPVTITGTGFGAPMTVTFGGQAATNVAVVNATTLTMLTPPMVSTTLAVNVVVTNGASQSATLVNGFTYTLRVPENPTPTQAGLTYRYHRVAGPAVPNFTGLVPYRIGVASTLTVVQGSPGAANPFDAGYNTNWSVEYLGYLTVPADDLYTFYTQADDQTQVFIGNSRVVNNLVANVESAGGSIGLAAGTHRFTVRMAQATGTFSLNVRWASSSIIKQAIPDNVLWTDITPTFTAAAPTVGTIAGGNTITITGTGFTSGSTVTMGGTAATGVVVASNGLSLTAVAPAHAIGPVSVVVTNSNGLSVTQANSYTYQGLVPTVTAVSPLGGPLAGGTAVLIYGSNFAAGASVTIGGAAATNVLISSGVITATTPPGARGPATVVVQNVDAQSASRSPGFYFQGPTPTITSLSVTTGSLAGGTTLTISGTGFFVGANVTFDGVTATGVTVVDANTITITTPANAQGPSDLVVANVDLLSATRSSAFIFEGPAPTLTGVSPPSGALAGGTLVTLTGTNFAAGVTVTFDGVSATGVTVVNGTTITATTPAGAQGPADMVVTNVDLLSTTLTNGYIFLGAPPVIGTVNPVAAPNYLSTPITITGSGFAVGIQITIGGIPVTITSLTPTTVTVTMPAGLPPGPAPLVMTNVDLQSATYGAFIAQGQTPTITTITPARGPLGGGTAVTISGTNFYAGTSVTFDGVSASGITVVDSFTITVVTPANAQGLANVVVTNVDLLSAAVTNGFIFEGPVPTLTGVSPPSGALAGGTLVTLTGTNFAAGVTVTFDGVSATGVTVVNGTTITATTPAGAQGPADVVVTNVDLLSAMLTNGYIFLGAPPVITGVNPLGVPNNLSTPITISGSGFVPGIQVTIGGVPATVTSMTATAVIVTMPSGLPPGPADVVVTNIDLQTVVFTGFIAQGPAPILTGIDVPFGPVAGGRRMTLTGSDFRAGAIVTMGGVSATVLSITPTTIVALTPAQGEGPVTVTVTNDDLLSSSLVDAYSYYTRSDHSVSGNGCGTGGGLAVFLLLGLWMIGGGVANRRR